MSTEAVARLDLVEELEAMGAGVLWGQLSIAPPSSAQAAELRGVFEEERAWQLEHLGWLPLMGRAVQCSALGRCVVERSFLLVARARGSRETSRVVFAHCSGALYEVGGRFREMEAYVRQGRMLTHERHLASPDAVSLFDVSGCDLEEVPRFVSASARPERALAAALETGDGEAAQEAFEATLASYPVWSRYEVARRAIEQTRDPSSELARDFVDTLESIARRAPIARALGALLARARDASSRVTVAQFRALGPSGSVEVETTWRAAIAPHALESLERGVAAARAGLAPPMLAHFDGQLAACGAVQAALCAARAPDAWAAWPVRVALWVADALERRAVAALVVDADAVCGRPDEALRALVASRLSSVSEAEAAALFPDVLDEVVARVDSGWPDDDARRAAIARASAQEPSFELVPCAMLIASLDREEAAAALAQLLATPSAAASVETQLARAALRSLQLRRYVEERGVPSAGDAHHYRVASRAPDTKGWQAATLGWLRVIWTQERRFDFDRRLQACDHGVRLGDAGARALLPALERAEQGRQRKL